MLAAKTALTIRYDALGENTSAEMGAENRLKVETRLRQLEEKGVSISKLTVNYYQSKYPHYANETLIGTFTPSGLPFSISAKQCSFSSSNCALVLNFLCFHLCFVDVFSGTAHCVYIIMGMFPLSLATTECN